LPLVLCSLVYRARIVFHSYVVACLIHSPSIARLVWSESASLDVASLASLSASSFPSTSVWPGTQLRVIVAPFATICFAAVIARIWQSCPGLSEGVFSLYRPA